MDTLSQDSTDQTSALLSSEPAVRPSRGSRGRQKRIMLADPDETLGAMLEDLAGRLGCRTMIARDFESFAAGSAASEPDVVLMGLRLGDRDAVQVLRHLSEQRSHAYIVLIGDGDVKVVESVERLGRGRRMNMLPSLERPVSAVTLRMLLRGVIDARPDIGPEELREGMAGRQFVPYFQPIIDLRGREGRMVRAEVLARWDHPFHGLLSASEFIGAAEEYGCIEEMTVVLLGAALEQASACREGGHSLPISLNISTTSLNDLSLPDTLADILSNHGFRNDVVTIELTESAMAEQRVETLDILTRLRLKGFGLSMDDFGTGYSTLLELVRLPFNEIKIDPRFIDQVGVRRESGIVIRSAIALAHGLGMTVCAEGVESPDTLEFLRGAGCDAVQGRSILEPVSGHDLLEFLESRKPASN